MARVNLEGPAWNDEDVRAAALSMTAQVYRGQGGQVSNSTMIRTAESFERYLRGWEANEDGLKGRAGG